MYFVFSQLRQTPTPWLAYLAYSGLGSRGRGCFVASFARTLPGSGLLKHIWLFDIFFWSSSPTNPIPIYLICPIWLTSDPTVFWGLVKHRGDKWLWRIPGVQKIKYRSDILKYRWLRWKVTVADTWASGNYHGGCFLRWLHFESKKLTGLPGRPRTSLLLPFKWSEARVVGFPGFIATLAKWISAPNWSTST